MEIILTIIIYAIQILAIGFLPALLVFLLSLIWKNRKKLLVLFAVLLTLEIAGAFYLSRNPFWECSDAYSQYISDAQKQEIIGFHSGIYSANIPVFPIYVCIKYADADCVIVETYYFAFGRTEMSITADGPSYLSGFG